MPNSKRLRVLWLCSWYPSEVEPFSGDFIQRHAEAVGDFADVHILHAVGSAKYRTSNYQYRKRTNTFSESVCVYPKANFWQKWFSAIRWWMSMMRMFRVYRKQVGIPDLVHVQVLFKSGLLARYLYWRYGLRYVVTEHYGIYNDKVSDRFANRSFLFRLLSRFGYAGATCSISVSEYLQGQMNRFLTYKPHVVIPNAVNTHLFFPIHSANRPFVFLHVSELTDNKNPMAIIRVFQKIRKLHPSIFLQVVGSLRNQPVLRESYEELESTGIHFSGEISYEQVSLYMKQSDCLILFSHMENSPCVIGEALCSGLQVIASDVGGVKELIDLECSQLVQAGDEEALCVAMLKALDRKVLIDRFGVAERARAKFSYKVVGESIYQAYAGLHLERTELNGTIS